jgi:hypothetical protein
MRESDDDASYGDGTYGDGETVTGELPGDTGGDTAGVDESATEDESPFDGAVLAHDGSPPDGVDVLTDDVREARFGEDDAAGAGPLDTDAVDLEIATDLDLTGDGIVDPPDPHEAAPAFDFGVSDGGHHDGGPIDR